jgi:hypothetical protein
MASLRMPPPVLGVRLPPQQDPTRAEFNQLCAAGELTMTENFLRVFQSTDNTSDSTIQRPVSVYEYGFCEAVRHGKMHVVGYLIRQGCFSWSISAAVEHATNSGSTECSRFLWIKAGIRFRPIQGTRTTLGHRDQNTDVSRMFYPSLVSDLQRLLHQVSLVWPKGGAQKWANYHLVPRPRSRRKYQNYGGRTTISGACGMAPLSVVQLLVSRGADVKDKDVVTNAAISHAEGIPGRI